MDKMEELTNCLRTTDRRGYENTQLVIMDPERIGALWKCFNQGGYIALSNTAVCCCCCHTKQVSRERGVGKDNWVPNLI